MTDQPTNPPPPEVLSGIITACSWMIIESPVLFERDSRHKAEIQAALAWAMKMKEEN